MPSLLGLVAFGLACAGPQVDSAQPDPRLYPMDGEWKIRYETYMDDALISAFVYRGRRLGCETASFGWQTIEYGLRFHSDGTTVDAVLDGLLDCSPTDVRPWHDEMFYATIAWRESFQEETGGRRFFDVYDVLDNYDLEQVGSELVGPEWRITPESDDSSSYRLFDDDAIALMDPGPIVYVP